MTKLAAKIPLCALLFPCGPPGILFIKHGLSSHSCELLPLCLKISDPYHLLLGSGRQTDLVDCLEPMSLAVKLSFLSHPINLSHDNLILGPARRTSRGRGNFFLPNTREEFCLGMNPACSLTSDAMRLWTLDFSWCWMGFEFGGC